MASKYDKTITDQPRPKEEDWVLLKVSGITTSDLKTRAEDLALSLGASEQDFHGVVNGANNALDYPWRDVVVARSATECAQKLVQKLVNPELVLGQASQKKLCFLFPGHGAHYPGMGQELYRNNSVARQALDYCFQRLKKQHNLDMESAMWGEDHGLLSQPKYGLVAIFCVEYALLRLWKYWGIQPDYVLGHNSGELVAALAVGLIDLDEALDLVVQLSKVIEAMPPGQTMAVWGTEDQVLHHLEKGNMTDGVDIVALNTFNQTVVTGSAAEIQKLDEFLARQNVGTKILSMGNGSYWNLTETMLRGWTEAVQATTWNKAANSGMYVSAMEGQVVVSLKQGPSNYWLRLPRAKVNFLRATETLLNLGVVNFVDMLPKAVLSPLVTITGRCERKKVNALSERHAEGQEWNEWAGVLRSLGKVYKLGYSVDWGKFNKSCAKPEMSRLLHAAKEEAEEEAGLNPEKGLQ